MAGSGPTYTPIIYNTANDLTGRGSRARVGGSTFTVFTWMDRPIAFARQITHQSPAPVGPGTTPIHPLDTPYPVELITAQALTMGTIVLELYELYGASVWQRLSNDLNGGNGFVGPAGANAPVDLANIFASVANSQNPIYITRIIRPPLIRGQTMSAYTEEFHNCVVSNIEDGETIEVGTMEVLKRLTLNYTHITRGGFNTLLSDSSNVGSADKIAAPPGPG